MDRMITRKKWPPGRIAGLSALIVLILVIAYSLLFGDNRSRLNVKADKITISTVVEGTFQQTIPISGTVLPIQTVYLDATQGGRVEAILIEEGSFVEAGDVILKLDNTDLQLDIFQREALLYEQINNLRATRLSMEQNSLNLRSEILETDHGIEQQKRVYERSEKLYHKGLIPRDEYEDERDQYNYLINKRALTIETQRQDSLFRQLQVEQLESSVDRMKSNLDMVKQKLDNLQLRAPVSGQLTSLFAEIGQSKSQGERLGQIDILDGFKIRADIDEFYIARVQTGLKGEFDFSGEVHELVITKIYPQVEGGRFEVDMEFTGPQPDGIRRGQTVHIRLALDEPSSAILLPKGGFYQKTGGAWVFRVDESGDYAVRQDIRINRQNIYYYEVMEGLQAGDNVITSSYETFGDHEKLILK